jgi:hypothetical protein
MVMRLDDSDAEEGRRQRRHLSRDAEAHPKGIREKNEEEDPQSQKGK